MLRRVAATSAISTVSAVRMSSIATTSSILLPKVDFHKDVDMKYTPKAVFNPYSPGFMENLQRKSESASQPSTAESNFQLHQHTGTFITADSNYMGY